MWLGKDKYYKNINYAKINLKIQFYPKQNINLNFYQNMIENKTIIKKINIKEHPEN